MAAGRYEIEFYEDENGREPCREWIETLSEGKRAALLAALKYVLGQLGLDVCKTEYGKNLGGGVAELRLRHSERVILGRFAEDEQEGDIKEGGGDESILLRVFFHAHGKRQLLLLGGYDKGKHPKERRQQREIELARKRLQEWKRRLRAARKRTRRRRR